MSFVVSSRSPVFVCMWYPSLFKVIQILIIMIFSITGLCHHIARGRGDSFNPPEVASTPAVPASPKTQIRRRNGNRKRKGA